ncbi:MAG: hypothetical protein JXA30_22655 [Deltaproteobacteria bacterium]|nr:hypothetical protein [Deltaproteobacteria bacterium]
MSCMTFFVWVTDVRAKSLSDVELTGTAEFGFIGVAAHRIQFGNTGTEFDYVKEGGQDVLFFFSRYSLEITLFQAHNVSFLYQPLDIESSVILDRDIVIDEQQFDRDAPVNLRYGFDFYRIGYDYDLFAEYPEHRLSLGAALQIRNATIDFSSADGELRRTQRDVGPVPLLRLRGMYSFQNGWWLGAEVDGFYAPIKYINGGDSDVEGAILDSSVRLGYNLHRSMDVFANIRYLGGGAEGTSKDDSDRGDGFVSNWLHTLSFTIGIKVKPREMLTTP